jgi:hypothetical protein
MARKAKPKKKPARTVSPKVPDAATQALLLIVGSGPAIAAFDGVLAANQASGLLYHNAVANQQKTNILGMAMSAYTVRMMLDQPKPKARRR